MSEPSEHPLDTISELQAEKEALRALEHQRNAELVELQAQRDELAAERDALKADLAFADLSQPLIARARSEKQRADRVEAACARFVGICCPQCRDAWKEFLATDAGRGWVTIDDVKPILECLHESSPALVAFLAKHGDKLRTTP